MSNGIPTEDVGSAANNMVSRRRSTPHVYVVDRECRVLLASFDPADGRSNDGILRPGERLTPPIEAMVRSLLEEAKRSDVKASAQTDGQHLVRVKLLTGLLGSYVGVFIERLRSRDTLSEAGKLYSLTRRETDVLELLVRGFSTPEVAAKLNVAKSTVILHVKSLLSKTGSRSRTEMLAKILAAHDDRCITNGHS